MALKDLSTNEAADILVQLAPHMDNITSDEKLVERIGKSINRDGMTRAGIAVEALHRVFDCIPILLVNHRDDVFGIVGVVKRKELDEIKNQSIIQTKNDLKEILTDEDLRDFFGMLDF